jgi:hypothetical protein
MSQFIIIKQRLEDSSTLISWIREEEIAKLNQNYATQAPNNEGSITLYDGGELQLIAFNETLEALGLHN